jgi:hypothetical protein
MAAYLLWEWLNLGKIPRRKKSRHMLAAIGISAVPVLVFYVPFILHIDAETRVYWSTRFVEEAAEKLSSSILLFNIYQPVFILAIYVVLFVASMIFCVYLIMRRDEAAPVFWIPSEIPKHIFKKNLLATFAWFLVPFIFMEGIVYQPGTHMYTYLIPTFIFIGVGMYSLEQVIQGFKAAPRLYSIYLLVISVMFVFIYTQSYAIFVDHAQEYPWEDEKFLLWTLRRPPAEITENYTLSMFGFPYFRNWEGIGEYIRDHNDFNSVSANEPDVVTNFYVRKNGRRFSPYRYYISIQNPRSYVPFLNERMAVLASTQEAAYRILDGEETIAEIFLIENQR